MKRIVQLLLILTLATRIYSQELKEIQTVLRENGVQSDEIVVSAAQTISEIREKEDLTNVILLEAKHVAMTTDLSVENILILIRISDELQKLNDDLYVFNILSDETVKKLLVEEPERRALIAGALIKRFNLSRIEIKTTISAIWEMYKDKKLPQLLTLQIEFTTFLEYLVLIDPTVTTTKEMTLRDQTLALSVAVEKTYPNLLKSIADFNREIMNMTCYKN